MTNKTHATRKDEGKESREPSKYMVLILSSILLVILFLFRKQLPEEPWWAWAIVGIGCKFLAEVVIRSIKPELEIPDQDYSKSPFPGLLLIFIGSLILFIDQLTRAQWVSWALVGAGCINVVVIIFRVSKPEYKKPDPRKFTLGIILIVIGAVTLYEFWFLWVLIGFIAGICVLALLFHQSKHV